MKTFSLTSKKQKIGCVLIDLFFLSFYLAFIIMRLTLGVAFYVFAGFVILLCTFYSLIIFNSKIKIDPVSGKLYFHIFQKIVYDLKAVSEIRILTKTMDRREIRVIGLFDQNGTLVGEINPHFAMGEHPRFDEIVAEIKTVIDKND
ncbi:MAG: hypothetical protein GX904_02045 [Acholeplasmataceae bacterium]|nr:hypothetical protein [Acholeplasmataceae bacterium]